MAKSGRMVEAAERQAILTERRNLKMARSAHAYVRGNTSKFYEWLAEDHKSVPHGPPIWICGDCHVGNLGPVASSDGEVDIQIRDLDQTVIGNPAHDLIRLGLSLASAARGSDLPGVATARILEAMMVGYQRALTKPAPDGPERQESVPEPDVVATVKRRALGRKWRDLATDRLKDASPAIPRDDNFWSLAPEEGEAIDTLFGDEELRARIASWRADSADVAVIDKAYWMKGCSSLGNLRYAVLLRSAREGKTAYHLIDVKEAVKAAAPAAANVQMPRDHAQRVVKGARALSPFLGERMAAARLLGRPVIIRELAPQDLKLEISQFSRAQAVGAARYLAYVVGKAHARQMDEATRDTWAGKTRRNAAQLDAPSWLWRSVVDLMGSHEIAYLEHCRRYAR